MLGGLDPLIVFSFPLLPVGSPAANAIAGIPLVGETILANVAIPIPIYLSENLTGIFVQSESRSIDIDTDNQARKDGKGIITNQKGLDSIVTVEMVAKKDSIPLIILLSTCDMIFTKVVSKEYSVSYFNGATNVFNGLLHGFQTQADTDTDLLKITLQISKSNAVGTKEATNFTPISKTTGGVPNIRNVP